LKQLAYLEMKSQSTLKPEVYAGLKHVEGIIDRALRDRVKPPRYTVAKETEDGLVVAVLKIDIEIGEASGNTRTRRLPSSRT
jgi:hypothetical protein